VTVTTHSLFACAYEEGFAVSGRAINLTECHRHGAHASAGEAEHKSVHHADLALLSRYSTQLVIEHGEYTLKLAREPGPWLSEPTFRQAIQLSVGKRPLMPGTKVKLDESNGLAGRCELLLRNQSPREI
jgi:hypothetical protein